MRNRSVGSHRMNDYSSRSHTILSVHITSELQAEGGVFISKQGKINFVDLAGSEMTKKTNSEGKTLEEANNINKSLMVLGKFTQNALLNHYQIGLQKGSKIINRITFYVNKLQKRGKATSLSTYQYKSMDPMKYAFFNLI